MSSKKLQTIRNIGVKMKYINKDIQQYLAEEQLQSYKDLKRKRIDFIKKNSLPVVKMYNRWSKKSWHSIPKKRNIYYIENETDKENVISYYRRISEFNEKIKKIERQGWERKELAICKPGNIVVSTHYWWRNEKFLIQEKADRDNYALFSIKSARTIIVKWTDLVQYFILSEVSK